MPLKLEIISEHSDIVGDDAVREFRSGGGTIGRSLDNDWILTDPDKFVYGKHATVDCKGGIYYLVDISTNGVFINDESKPIGKGNLRRLFNGDHLHMGDFEILVSIDEGEDLEMPAAPKPTVVPDHIEQLVEEDRPRTGVQLLDEDEMTGAAAFESILLAGDTDEALAADEMLQAPEEREPPMRQLEQSRPAQVKVSNDDLFDAFLDGLQISRADLTASLDIARAVYHAGEILREYIIGVESLRQNRAEFKSALRLDQTTILPTRNNPIKLSRNTDDLVRQLLTGDEGKYLGPRLAVREVCRDLLAHQEAFLDAMTQAFVEFAERFDPEELTADFERSLGRKPFFRLLNELKYWSLYKDLYPTMTEKGGGRFPQTFAEGFVNAYERHIIVSQRERRAGQLLPEVKPEPRNEAAVNAAPEAHDEPVDQLDNAPDMPPHAVLENITDPSGHNEVLDFDPPEANFGTVDSDDDAGRARG